MPKESEYHITRGSTTRWFFITKGEKAFSVERVYDIVADTTNDNIYGKDGELIYIGKDHKEISAAISKYIEKEKRTVQIEVKGGTVVDVRNLPEGCNYELIDRDIMEEER